MVRNEKELASAIMCDGLKIELSENLVSGVEKIKCPSNVVWMSVAAALAASAFFWASGPAILLGIAVGLPVILTVSGGVGGIVFVTLGAQGTLCAFRLLIAAQTMDVLTRLRDEYDLDTHTLVHK